MKFKALLGVLPALVILPLAAQPLRVATLPNSAYNAVGVPLIESLYREIGVEINTLEVPPARQARMMELGQLDAVVALPPGFNRQHPEYIRLEVPISSIKMMLFTTRTDLEWPLPPGLSVGLLRGMSTSTRSRLPEGLQVVEVNNQSQMMRMVVRQRLDLVALPRIEGLAAIEALGLDNVHIIGPAVSEVSVYHYLHERHRDLVEPLTQVMQGWHDSGYMEAEHQRFREQLERRIARCGLPITDDSALAGTECPE